MDMTEPFPLYPEEVLVSTSDIVTIPRNAAAKMTATRDFDDEGTARKAGDEWIIFGPKMYIPRIECAIAKIVLPEIITRDRALKIKAKRECTDANGVDRKSGEEWLIRTQGFYLPQIDEITEEMMEAQTLTETLAIHLTATQTFTDIYNVVRKAGQEWLITHETSSSHIADVYETIVGTVQKQILSSDEFCYILDPVDKDGNNQVGQKVLRVGPCSYFLYPGESLESGIQKIYALDNGQSLLLRATEDGDDKKSGSRWMVSGPCRYVPPVWAEVLEERG